MNLNRYGQIHEINRLVECLLPYTLPDGHLVFTVLPGLRNHGVNYNIKHVKVYCLQERTQTQEETMFCLFNQKRIFVY